MALLKVRVQTKCKFSSYMYLRLLAIYARESSIRLQIPKLNLIRVARHYYIEVYVTSLQYMQVEEIRCTAPGFWTMSTRCQ